MANQTLRDLVVSYAGKGASIDLVMSHLTKKSGILKTAQAIPANYNIYHKYKKVSALPTFTVGGVVQDLTDVTVSNDVYQQELCSIDAIQTEYKKLCDNYPGGARAFFRDQYLAFIEGWGQAASTQLIYGTDATFGNEAGTIGFHQIAKANSKVVQCGGTTASRSTIFAVKWDSQTCGVLFNPVAASSGNFLKVTALHGGNPYPEVINDGGSDQSKKLVYGTSYESYLGLLSASAYDIAALTQIQDDTGDLPTAARIDQIIDYVHGDEGSTFLYMNRDVRRMCRTLKDSKLELGAFDKNYDMRIDYWNGIPIVTDENILSTETTVLD